MRKFVISDLHFGHDNVLTYEPMRSKYASNTEEMDEFLIKKWNSIVKPDDHTYIAGDFSFHDDKKTKEILNRLNGFKHLIFGNHDFDTTHSKFISMGFSSVQMELILKISKNFMVKINHFPYKGNSSNEAGSYEKFRPVHQKGIWLVHGHMHSKGKKIDVENQSICISCELWNFTPVNFDNILALVNKELLEIK